MKLAFTITCTNRVEVQVNANATLNTNTLPRLPWVCPSASQSLNTVRSRRIERGGRVKQAEGGRKGGGYLRRGAAPPGGRGGQHG